MSWAKPNSRVYLPYESTYRLAVKTNGTLKRERLDAKAKFPRSLAQEAAWSQCVPWKPMLLSTEAAAPLILPLRAYLGSIGKG